MPELYLRSSSQLRSFIKKHCGKEAVESKRIYFPKKGYYGDLEVLIIVKGEIYTVSHHGYVNSDDEDQGWFCEIPKLKEYFAGREYDTNKYYQFYGKNAPEGVFQYPNDNTALWYLENHIRANSPRRGFNISMKEVPRPETGFVAFTGEARPEVEPEEAYED